jgi:uncharacterized phosphatase
MKICLVRHGETDWNNIGKLQGREDVPLNMAGIEQMNETAGYLKDFAWNVIISSPLSRAKKSAEIISGELGGIKIIEDFDLVERDYGKASGMTLDERKIHFPDDIWIGAEPFDVVQNRTVNALLKHAQEYDGDDIIIVSHGAAINAILIYFGGNEIATEKSPLKNACMSLLEKNKDQINVVFSNKVADELRIQTMTQAEN